MTPQDLVKTLLNVHEEQARQLLQAHVPIFSDTALDRLVYLVKKEADRCWNTNALLSYTLSGYLLFIGTQAQNEYYHALGLMARGDALRRLDRDQEALPFFDAAGEEFLAMDDEVGWARTRIGRMSACLHLNRTTEALKDASAAHEIFMRHGKLLRAGQIDVNAAIINYELGQHDQALRLFDRAIETYLQLGEGIDLHIARARGNKALALAAQGRFREAAALHEQARTTFAAHGEREEISVAREELNIADIYAAQGHYSQALLLYNQSRALFQRHPMEFAAAEVAQQMCLCLVRLNRAREAYELAGETVNFFRASPVVQRHNLARSLMHQAAAATMLDNFGEADEMLREASDLLEEGGFVRLAAFARLRRAELYFADKQLEAAAREAQHVADAFADQEDLPQLARATLLQARIADAMGRAEVAQDLCDQALDIARAQGLLDLKYMCDDLLGQLAEQRGALDEATRFYDSAVQCIDEVQSRLVLDERTSFLEDKGGIYQHAVALAMKRGNRDQALIYVEKAKSRVLGDYLRNNIDIRLRAGDKAGEAILEDLSRLREEQAWFSSIVYESDESNLSDTAVMRIRAIGPTRARSEMQSRERRIEQLLEQMQLRSAGDLVARPRPNWTNSIVTSLWPKLESDTVMLEYYLADQDLYIFQLTRSGVEVQVVPQAVPRLDRLMVLWRANLDLAAQASGMLERAQSFSGLQENCLGLLQRLYDLLLRPVSDALNACAHLIVVPYGMLHYLPFHCLFDGVQFVVERLNVSYLPAAALLDICRQRGQRIQARGVRLQDALVMGLSDNGRLQYAVQEAEVVAHQLGTTPVLNEAASAAVLWSAGEQSPIVHIAAHGLFRLDAPNFSHIKLADRQLSAIEVFNLNLSSCSLVTLSACETGRAVVGGVDEVIGLGRGFLYAGAASLLPTLWKVDDASSAELMEMFYQGLLSGYGKAAALAAAQRAFIARSRTSVHPYRIHPYFWAAFHLIGDAGML
ncbi:MAG: CHAT domain-containing protein [Chloroflexota bacterium]|nr:CHAT domain-containing protein [Chloroflexota bacterium]